MTPTSPPPNAFELTILRRLASKEPSISEAIEQLHVVSREFTHVGSYTTFHCEEPDDDGPRQHVGLDTLINMPGVPDGMGAVLFLKGGRPECLEIYTFGDPWDGAYDGFSIDPSPEP